MGQLFPSLRTNQLIIGSQDNLAFDVLHYDWVGSAYPPIDNWLTTNPYGIYNRYMHWLLLTAYPGSGGNTTEQWYDWCVTNAYDWENGFLHVGTSDTYLALANNDGYGTKYDAYIAYVYRNASTSDYAYNCWAGSAALSLATLNDAVYFGRLDRFHQVTLEFSTKASANWVGAWEYWNGATWVEITPTTDGTLDCTQNGTVTFSPPPTAAQWSRCKVNAVPTTWGASGIYFLRLRCKTAGTTGPVISKAQGRHYWVHNSTVGNTVPAWDDLNDDDADGFAELTVVPAATALFKYESRVPHYWSWESQCLHVTDANIIVQFPNFTIAYLDAYEGTLGPYYGCYLDDSSGNTNVPSAFRAKLLEYPGKTADEMQTQWRLDYSAFVVAGSVTVEAAGYHIGGNVGYNGNDTLNGSFSWHMREDFNRWPTYYWEDRLWPATAQWQKWGDTGVHQLLQFQFQNGYRIGDQNHGMNLTHDTKIVTASGTNWTHYVSPGDYIRFQASGVWTMLEIARVDSDVHLTLVDTYTGVTQTSAYNELITHREYMEHLATFLSMQDPDVDTYSSWINYYYDSDWNPLLNWIPAAVTDLGTPTGIVPPGKSARGTRGAYVYQSGYDPSYPSVTYRVYARDYNKGMVMVRPIPHANSSFDADSAVTVTLPRSMKIVNFDGTLSAAVDSVTLRNAQGVMLITAESPGPHTISGTILDDADDPIGGVTLSGFPSTTITEVDGTYSCIVDDGWSGTVIPTKADYAFLPTSKVYTSVITDLSGEDYEGTLGYTISGRVTTTGTSGVVGVVAELTGFPVSVVTDANGYYSCQVPNLWDGTITPVKSGYTLDPTHLDYVDVAADIGDQDYVGTLDEDPTTEVYLYMEDDAIKMLKTLATLTNFVATAWTYSAAYDFLLHPGGYVHAFSLSVSAAAAVAADFLDVKIQESSNGVTWTDVEHGSFTHLPGDTVEPYAETLHCTAGMARYIRVAYKCTDGGAHGQSFSFSVAHAVLA